MLNRACDLLTRGAKMGRADRGLFHGKEKQYGNKISFSHRTSRRDWTPNIQSKKYTSHLLNVTIKIPVTTKAIRCIDKAGGLDEYLLTTHPEDIASKNGMELRSLLIPKWEEQQRRPYDRRQLVFEQRLFARSKAGRLPIADAIQLINHSREQLAKRKNWGGEIPLVQLPATSRTLPGGPLASSSTPSSASVSNSSQPTNGYNEATQAQTHTAPQQSAAAPL